VPPKVASSRIRPCCICQSPCTTHQHRVNEFVQSKFAEIGIVDSLELSLEGIDIGGLGQLKERN
jgi:hypothetical protein